MGKTGVWSLVVCALAMGGGASGQRMEFDYKDPKEISSVSLAMESKLEPIFGYAKGISGKVLFDPANPLATSGTIAVDVNSVQFANEGYTATARGGAGLNAAKYPKILFTLKRVMSVKKSASNVYQAVVQADFSCHGVTTPLTVPVTATYFPRLAEQRTNGQYKGDVLILRTRFNVSRTKQGISAGIPLDLVGDTVEVRVACVGIHYTDPQARPDAPKKPADTPKKPNDKPAAVAPVRSYVLEIEERDDPVRVRADFVLDGDRPKAAFRTANGSLDADRIAYDGTRLTFHLPANPVVGAMDGSATFRGQEIVGTLTGDKTRLRFHGRTARESDTKPADVSAKAADVPVGTGFRDLRIVADGRTWTLAERMKFYHVPGLSVARIADFGVAETGRIGVANVETGEPVTDDTLFQAGSLGSPLVNIAALRLAADGRLDLSRPANAYLKDWRIPENDFTRERKITVADLICGTSGLSQYKFVGYRPDAAVPTLLALFQGNDPEEMEAVIPVAVPGGKFRSLGINQTILQRVLTDATGKAFPALMEELVFAPLGMTRSCYDPVPTGNPAFRVAVGHYSTGERLLDKFHIYPESAASGLWTTAPDFAKALCEVQKLLDNLPNALLPPEKRGLLAAVSNADSVLGLLRDGKGFLYHGGNPYGYFANHRISERKGVGIVVMQNRILSWRLHNEIVEAAAQQYGWKGEGGHE